MIDIRTSKFFVTKKLELLPNELYIECYQGGDIYAAFATREAVMVLRVRFWNKSKEQRLGIPHAFITTLDYNLKNKADSIEKIIANLMKMSHTFYKTWDLTGGTWLAASKLSGLL